MAGRRAIALSNADFLTSHYGAKTDALAGFAVALALPWADFEAERAVAEETAWSVVRVEYLA